MISEEGSNLVFILSAPRSGSTLLGAILGSHSQIFCPPEPWLLLPLFALRSHDTVIVANYDHALAQEAWQQWVNDSLFNQGAAAFARTIYDSQVHRSNKQIFVDKTPRYYHILPFIETLFPKASMIWLQRNPLDIVASCKRTWGVSVDELMGEVISPHSFDTTLSFVLLASYFSTHRPYQYVFHYEDLVRDPAAHINSLCNFLKVPFEASMLTYADNADLMRLYTEKVMGDKNLLQHTKAHDRSIGHWREILNSEEIQQTLKTLGRNVFIQQGYEDALHDAAEQAGLDLETLTDEGDLDRVMGAYGTYTKQDLALSPGLRDIRLSRENSALRTQLSISESDRAARLEVINQLSEQLRAGAEERAVHLQTIAQLDRRLISNEIERAGQIEEIHNLKELLATNEAQYAYQIRELQRTVAWLSTTKGALRKLLGNFSRQMGIHPFLVRHYTTLRNIYRLPLNLFALFHNTNPVSQQPHGNELSSVREPAPNLRPGELINSPLVEALAVARSLAGDTPERALIKFYELGGQLHNVLCVYPTARNIQALYMLAKAGVVAACIIRPGSMDNVEKLGFSALHLSLPDWLQAEGAAGLARYDALLLDASTDTSLLLLFKGRLRNDMKIIVQGNPTDEALSKLAWGPAQSYAEGLMIFEDLSQDGSLWKSSLP